MSNVVRFPASNRIRAMPIPREEFERLAELALNVVDQIVAILDATDGNLDPQVDRASALELTQARE